MSSHVILQVVPDNYQYARIARCVKDKSTLTEDKLAEITEITGANLLLSLCMHTPHICTSHRISS